MNSTKLIIILLSKSSEYVQLL